MNETALAIILSAAACLYAMMDAARKKAHRAQPRRTRTARTERPVVMVTTDPRDAERAASEERERKARETQERREAEARSIYEHYAPVLRDLQARYAEAEERYRRAEAAGVQGDALEKLRAPVDRLNEKIFQTSRKLERATSVLDL